MPQQFGRHHPIPLSSSSLSQTANIPPLHCVPLAALWHSPFIAKFYGAVRIPLIITHHGLLLGSKQCDDEQEFFELLSRKNFQKIKVFFPFVQPPKSRTSQMLLCCILFWPLFAHLVPTPFIIHPSKVVSAWLGQKEFGKYRKKQMAKPTEWVTKGHYIVSTIQMDKNCRAKSRQSQKSWPTKAKTMSHHLSESASSIATTGGRGLLSRWQWRCYGQYKQIRFPFHPWVLAVSGDISHEQ